MILGKIQQTYDCSCSIKDDRKTGRNEVDLPGRIYANYPDTLIIHIYGEKTRELLDRKNLSTRVGYTEKSLVVLTIVVIYQRTHRLFTIRPIVALFLVLNCQVCYILLIDVVQLLVFSTITCLTKAKRISPFAASMSGGLKADNGLFAIA